MDMPLLSNPVSDYNKREMGARFMVDSEGAPYYGLTRSARTTRAMPVNRDRGHAKNLTGRDTANTGAHWENHTPCRNQTRAANRSGVVTMSGDWRSSDRITQNGFESQVPIVRGRTEWRRNYLPCRSSRSRSLDWIGGDSSPARESRTGALTFFSGYQAGPSSSRSSSLERSGPKDRARAMVTEGRVMATAHSFNSGSLAYGHREKISMGSNSEPRLRRYGVEKGQWGQSLPVRLGGGQSIWERIEKLYSSTEPVNTKGLVRTKRLSVPVVDWQQYGGKGDATVARGERLSPHSSFAIASPTAYQWQRPYEGGSGGTFPRRFSRGDIFSFDAQQNSYTASSSLDRKRSMHPEHFTPSASPLPDSTGRRGSGTLCQSALQERFPYRSSVPPPQFQWDRGAWQLGTKSLDRGTAKFTKSRAAGEAGIMPCAIRQPQPPLKEESAALSPGRPRHADGRAERSEEESGTADTVEGRGGAETTGGTSHRPRHAEPRMRSAEPEGGKERKETQSDARKLGEQKTDGEGNGAVESGSLAEDVFDAPSAALAATERRAAPQRLIIPPTASVRNKIHQFESLSQRAGGGAGGQPPKPTRAFSVPAQPSGVSEGVKKSASEKSLSRLGGKWEWVKEGTRAEDKRREDEGNTSEGIPGRCSQESLDGIHSEKQECQVAQRSSYQGYEFMDEVGKGPSSRGVDVVESKSRDVAGSRSNFAEVSCKYAMQNSELEFPLNRQAKSKSFLDDTDVCKDTDSERPSKRDATSIAKLNLLDDVDPSSSSLEPIGNQNESPSDTSSNGDDGNRTPTNVPCDPWPFLSHHPLPDHSTPISTATATGGSAEESTSASDSYEQAHSTQEPSPYRNLVDLAPPTSDPYRKGKKRDQDLKDWVASVNQKIEGWSDDEDDDDHHGDDDDDDDSTEKDDDSNYDSDSGESSVTVTSNMSQSDRKSFCVSLADLCNFGGVDYESGSESEVWLPGRRSASLSSDASAFSCVSVLPTEELDRLLADVRSLDDDALQNYNDVQVVVLHKDIGVGLGFSMAGGADQNKPITVHKVFPLGAAAQEGSIRAGDQVLSINGTTLCGSGHWEATRTLRKAKSRGMGVVVLRRRGLLAPCQGGDRVDELNGAQTQSRDTGQQVCVQLEKQSRDLGFSLEGGVGSSLGDKPLSIQKVFQGGPASQVLPGDEVVEIQGVNTTGMRRLEVWTLIKGLPPGPVDVILRRPSKTLDI